MDSSGDPFDIYSERVLNTEVYSHFPDATKSTGDTVFDDDFDSRRKSETSLEPEYQTETVAEVCRCQRVEDVDEEPQKPDEEYVVLPLKPEKTLDSNDTNSIISTVHFDSEDDFNIKQCLTFWKSVMKDTLKATSCPQKRKPIIKKTKRKLESPEDQDEGAKFLKLWEVVKMKNLHKTKLKIKPKCTDMRLIEVNQENMYEKQEELDSIKDLNSWCPVKGGARLSQSFSTKILEKFFSPLESPQPGKPRKKSRKFQEKTPTPPPVSDRQQHEVELSSKSGVKICCSCGCGLEGCTCSEFPTEEEQLAAVEKSMCKCGCGTANCCCRAIPDASVTCLCGCDHDNCLCEKERPVKRADCKCGCHLDNCFCQNLDFAKLEDCPCGCGSPDCFCHEVDQIMKECLCGCGKASCICQNPLEKCPCGAPDCQCYEIEKLRQFVDGYEAEKREKGKIQNAQVRDMQNHDGNQYRAMTRSVQCELVKYRKPKVTKKSKIPQTYCPICGHFGCSCGATRKLIHVIHVMQ